MSSLLNNISFLQTRILSICDIVDNRCAIAITVFPLITETSVFCITAST